MKRSHAIAATVAPSFFLLVALLQVSVLTAKISSMPTPDGTTSLSPLSAPASAPRYDPYYRAHPRTMKAHAVPYINEAGETIVKEYIYQPPNGKTFEVAVFDELRFEDGKIVEHWGSPDRFALLAQLELLPQRQPATI